MNYNFTNKLIFKTFFVLVFFVVGVVINRFCVIIVITFLLLFFAQNSYAFRIIPNGNEWVVEETQSALLSQSSSEISYIYANGQRIASVSGSDVRYYHNDYLGSTRMTTTGDGEKESSLDYYPFGAVLKNDGPTDSYKFTGKEADKTGLQYFGARYYDSNTGRFTQTDPLANPSTSAYYYAAANPLKFVDPDGMKIKLITNTYYDNVMPHEQQANILANLYNNFMSSPLVTGKYASKVKELDNLKRDIIITTIYIDPAKPLLENAYIAYALTPNDNGADIYIAIDLETLDILQGMGLYKDTNALIAHELLGHVSDYVKNPEKYSKMSQEKKDNSAERVEKEFAGTIDRFSQEQEQRFFLEKGMRAINRGMQAWQDSTYNDILKSWENTIDDTKLGPLPLPE
jgi:RHS repeat-associated protein